MLRGSKMLYPGVRFHDMNKLSRSKIAGLAFIFLWFFIGGIAHFAVLGVGGSAAGAGGVAGAHCVVCRMEAEARDLMAARTIIVEAIGDGRGRREVDFEDF